MIKDALKGPRFSDWARAKLRCVVQRFFAAAPANDPDARELHRFRIRAKELRYALELLSGIFPRDIVATIYPVVEMVQQKPAEINDPATALVSIRERPGTAHDRAEVKHLQTLLGLEYARLDRVRREFLQWWSPPRKVDLETRLNELLARRHTLLTA